MGTLVDTDIDQFIRGHKTKLQQERSQFNQYTDQSRYPGGQTVISPSGRKQWDRNNAQATRPAEERRAPAQPEETGLIPKNEELDKKRQQLQAERQQEYNDILAQKGPRGRRRPRTPSQEGLPLGSYEKQRKAYEAERQAEMKRAMASKRAGKPAKANVFDYHEAEKAHMAEKRKEYNEFLDKKKQQSKRHIVTPEEGMFVGPDQKDRDQEIRERNRKNRLALEEQQREQLLFKARQHGEIPQHIPRKVPQPSYRQEAAVTHKPPQPPAAGQRSNQVQSHVIEERVMDMPKISPRRNEPVQPQPKIAFIPEQEQGPRRLPIYLEDRDEGQDRGHGRRGQGHPDYDRDERVDGEHNRQRDERDNRYDQRESLGRGHDRERGQGQPENRREPHRDDSQERHRLLEVRRSRSLSPPAERQRFDSPENILEEQKRMIEVLKKRQQILQDEYRREQAEEQRLATEREGLPIGASDRQKLDDERKKEYNEYLAKNAPQRSFRVKEPTPENLRQGLPLDQGRYNEKKRQLEIERQREYNELIQKQQPQQQHHHQQHYPEEPRGQHLAPAGGLLSPGSQQQTYENYEKPQQGGSRRADVLEGKGATLPVGELDDRRRQQLMSERQREYNEQQQQKLATQRQRGLPPKPSTPNHFFKNIGQHDRQQHVLNEERKKEYNQKLAQERGRTGRRGNYGAEQAATGLQFKNPDSAEVSVGKDVYATLPGLHYSDSAEARKLKTRNEEYNEFLQEKKWKDAHRFDNKKPGDARRHSEPSSPRISPRGKEKDFATLPGLHYSDSAEKRKMQERNKEYNEMLRQKQGGARKGWATPTYEEILEQKRREEALRRQDDDYGPADAGIRRYASEGAINRLQNDFRDRELDKEFESRKVRFDDEFRIQNQGGILNDDNWLNPEVRREQEYSQLDTSVAELSCSKTEQPVRQEIPDDMAARVRQQPFLASLPVGGAPGLGAGQDERESAKRRRQSELRRELQLQMEETKAARKREKVQELRVNASGLLDPEKSSTRMKGLEGQPGISPRREYRAKEVQPYHTKFLLDDSGEHDALGRRPGEYDIVRTAPAYAGQQGRIQGLGLGDLGGLGLGSPDHDVLGQSGAPLRTAPPLKGILSNGDIGIGQRKAPGTPQSVSDFGDDLQLDLGGRGGRERGRRRERDTGLLDPGFAGLLDSRRPIGAANPPPGLMYQPSFPSADQDKRYSEILEVPSLNPLSGTYVTGGGGPEGVSSIEEAYRYYGMTDPLQLYNGGGGGVPSLNLGGDYGGGGAPYRGSPTPRVTFADDPPLSTRRRDRSKERISPYQFASDDDIRSKSRSEAQSYGAELERQIQEKRLQKQREKERQERLDRKMDEEIATYNPWGKGGGGAPIRDEHGNPIADLRSVQKGGPGSYRSPRGHISPTYSPRPPDPRDDLIKAPPPQQTAFGEATHARGGHGIFGQPKTDAEKDQSDKYKDDLREQIAEKRRREQLEKEKERMEEEKENRRLEEQRIRMQTEYEEEQKKIRAREEETRRKNEELKKQAEDRKKEADRKKREAEDAKMKDQQEQIERERREREQREAAANDRIKSPPVPAIKTKTNDERGKSPPLPAQRRGRDSAASIRSQTSQRAQQSPAPGPSANRPNSSDVLTQLASMRKQLQSERRRVENALENSKNEPDVFDPRMVQRPPPLCKVYLVLISCMHNTNHAPFLFMTDPYDPTPSNMSFGRGRAGNISARSQLASNSQFIDVEGVNHFPEDFEDMVGARNDSARARRRERYSPRPYSNNGMGSQASLDVDRIQRKNEERLRKLNNMSSRDDVSMGDPDDILDRFMAKQRYNRPPSGQTLQDDSWLRPGSKAV
ncbi:trichohyalin-like [Mercenaria mercenaria]|uniref:trichohyalin-like n=1 Tax=Mercenaria mercenaria TaxID=6596 RepID=UPI00234F1601|nr:trichohyalin-like [Mercenaria mercenaria]